MSAANLRRDRPPVAVTWGAAGALVASIGAALVADHYGHHFTAQILLVAVAAFGGALFGAYQLLAPRHPRTRPDPSSNLRVPTATELHAMAGIACWEYDVRSETFVWNEGMYALYGVNPGVFVPTKRSMLDFVAPQDIQRVLDTWTKKNESPPAGTIECRIVRKDGDQRLVRFSWHAVDLQGANPKVFGLAQDVTTLRGRAEDLQLRGMVECSADYIWEHSAGVALGEGFRLETFGSEASGPNKPILDASSGHDFAALEQAFAQRAKFRDILVPVIDGRGETRWVNLSGHPQYDSAGEYYGYRGVGADVTDQMRERHLEEGRRQAGAMGRLASGLAHEINNLLQPILIYSACGAEEAKENEQQKLYFTRIARAAERASFIVRNVLSFARQTPPSREEINVLAIVRETADLMSGAIGARTQIEISAADNSSIVRAERTGLAQIITNLIANAADVMTDGGRISVRIDQVGVAGEATKLADVPPGTYCRIIVEDTGPGIPPDLIGRVFEPFFTTKPQGKGTGLGLAVVSGIAKSWGGGVAVESVPGRGSRFTVYLPATERELLAAQ